MALYSTLADADVTRPEIFQPSGAYPPEQRDLTTAVDGGGIFGTMPIGGAGYLEYEALVGTLDLDESYILTEPPITSRRRSCPRFPPCNFRT